MIRRLWDRVCRRVLLALGADTLVPPPANDADWSVWDAEAEAGMSDEQVAMLRQGYVLPPDNVHPCDGPDPVWDTERWGPDPDALTDEQALRMWQRVKEGIAADRAVDPRPASMLRAVEFDTGPEPDAGDLDAALSLDPDQGSDIANRINWGPGDRPGVSFYPPFQRKPGSGS